MKNQIKLLLALLFSLNIMSALEFGSLGNISASMGGAGVALKKSAWGLYYNPALLGADRRSKIGISLGANYKEQNLLELVTIDIDKISNLTRTLDQKLLSGGGQVLVNGDPAKAINGAIGNAIQNMIGSPTLDQNSLYAWAINLDINLTAPTNATTLQSVGQEIATKTAGDPTKLQAMKDSMLNATGGNVLLDTLVNSIDTNNMGNVIEQISKHENDPLSIQKLLNQAGSITIKKGVDKDIDALIDNYLVLQKAFESNDASVRSQNGVVIQIGGKKRGAIAFGVLPQGFVNGNGTTDSNHRQIIIDTGTNNYINVGITNAGINISESNSTAYNTSSILSNNANHSLHATMLSIVEVPIGYGHSFQTKIGEFNVGAALKYMHGFGYQLNKTMNLNDTTISFKSSDIQQTSNVGIDLGFLYSIKKNNAPRSFYNNLHFGLVAKNINSPKMKISNNQTITINPQLRAGISYDFLKYLTLAMDVDLIPNNTLSLLSPKSQTIGGGILADFKYIDLRAGMLKDIKSTSGEGLIATAGLNLIGLLDLSVQYGLGKSAVLFDTEISNFVDVKLGMQFSW